MTSRDNQLWQQCWRDRNTAFHQKTVNSLLTRFWPTLGLDPQARVFVPLCGKSLDLLWLAQQGHAVIGVELSQIAVRAFFHEHRMRPSRRQVGRLTRWEHANIAILCGDFFQLTAEALTGVVAVYDHAALTALPEDIRHAYLAHLEKVLPAACKMLLLTTEEPDEGETADQPFAIADEIARLYSPRFDIDLAHVESLFEAPAKNSREAPVRIEHKVYRLIPKAGDGLAFDSRGQ